ncbi:MAG: hypothetical protein JNL50_02145 [Phycisphaerae bacterium]|nr:hypothetical protein [Phycisphaerae bacterium]
MKAQISTACALLPVALVLAQPVVDVPPAPSPVRGLAYDAAFFPGAKYDASIPTPESVLGFAPGRKAATHAQIESVFRALSASKRTKLVPYAVSHEGRTLYYMLIGSERNIARLEELRAGWNALADQRGVDAARVRQLAESLPALAWMAYTIHGDETSGSDAALAVSYHLAACTDAPVRDLLENIVVAIDPLMNPDGRDRCLSMVRENRTAQPNFDDQSLLHTDTWPSGRMNHYLFDMNRDWLFATQPETKGRIASAMEWRPHFFMESHEMGSQDTFLFSPPREAINHNIPGNVRAWWPRVARDQAAAFDARSWRYYTGEWNDEWYPGYSGSWGNYRSAIGVLYEQASLIADGVRRAEGTIETYREAVHKQVVSSMANIATIAGNRAGVLADYAASRAANIAKDGPFAGRAIAIVPGANDARLLEFARLMEIQGVEMRGLARVFKASGKDAMGRAFAEREFPESTILIPLRQPEGPWAAASLELDPRLPASFLGEERRELLRFGRSRMYDITGWSLPLLFDLECYELSLEVPDDAVKAVVLSPRLPAAPEKPDALQAFVIDGGDDRANVAAARLMEAGLIVRAANKPFTFDGAAFARGSILVTRKDNQDFAGDLAKSVGEIVLGVRTRAVGVNSGLGDGDLPDLGGEHFVLLERPRIAVVGREPFNPYTFGEAWFVIDHELGIRASYLSAHDLSGADLRRYNTIVIPDAGGEGVKGAMESLRAWTESGGTLIAIGSSAAAMAREKEGVGSTRLLPDVLTKLEDFRLGVTREWEARIAAPSVDEVFSHTAPAGVTYPWILKDPEKPDEDEAKRRDAWRALFMPQGAILAARVDDRHWITGGSGGVLPVLYTSDAVLIPGGGAEAPIRFGAIVPAPTPDPAAAPKAGDATPADEKKEPAKEPPKESAGSSSKDPVDEKASEKAAEKPAPGWLLAPPGQELRLRMSGLLWPEAADRVAHSAYVTVERVGSGQVILFASSPTFRAGTKGTMRVFTNAVVLGAGMGASHPIRP